MHTYRPRACVRDQPDHPGGLEDDHNEEYLIVAGCDSGTCRDQWQALWVPTIHVWGKPGRGRGRAACTPYIYVLPRTLSLAPGQLLPSQLSRKAIHVCGPPSPAAAARACREASTSQRGIRKQTNNRSKVSTGPTNTGTTSCRTHNREGSRGAGGAVRCSAAQHGMEAVSKAAPPGGPPQKHLRCRAVLQHGGGGGEGGDWGWRWWWRQRGLIGGD